MSRFKITVLVPGVVVLILSGLGPWRSFGQRVADVKTPRDVLIIRHAEKPDADDDPTLTSRGAARAAALPSLFLAPPNFPTKPARFPTPDYIFAAKKSKNSNRAVLTIKPLAGALGDAPVQDKYKDADFQLLVNDLFGQDKFAAKTILICWHHGTMPNLALAILAKAENGDTLKSKVPAHVKSTDYHRIWQITFDASGQATFTNRSQKLLYNDSAN